jgi:hypothetical protein
MEGQPVNKSGNKQADIPIKKKKKFEIYDSRSETYVFRYVIRLTVVRIHHFLLTKIS